MISPNQTDLFAALSKDALEAENAPHLDLSIDIISIVNQCIRNSPLSRDQILDRVNLCFRDSDIKITTVAFNKWLSPSQANNIPAFALPAVCWAIQSDAPLQLLAQSISRKVVDMRGDYLRDFTERKLKASAELLEAEKLEKQMMQVISNNSAGNF